MSSFFVCFTYSFLRWTPIYSLGWSLVSGNDQIIITNYFFIKNNLNFLYLNDMINKTIYI